MHDTFVATPPVEPTEHVLPVCNCPTHVDSQTDISEQLVESSDGQVYTVVICETAVHA